MKWYLLRTNLDGSSNCGEKTWSIGREAGGVRGFDEMSVREEGTRCERRMSAGLGGIAGTEEEGPGVLVGWKEDRRVETSSAVREVEEPERVAILNPEASVNNPAFAAG
jgi:hypothetical protein